MKHNLVATSLIFAMSMPLALGMFAFPGPCSAQERSTDEAAAGNDAPVSRPRIGLALGGGGARAEAHIGVLRVLQREGVPIDYIAGTSMGAVIGGLFAAGLSPDQIEALYRSNKIESAYVTQPIAVRTALFPLIAMQRLVGKHPPAGLYAGGKFAEYIRKSVPKNATNIENLKIPFSAVACNLIDGEVYAIDRGDLGKALQCSTAVPIVRAPVEWQGKLFVDGGVRESLPVTHCRKMGADIVIAIDTDQSLSPVDPKTFRHMHKVAWRCVHMHIHQVDIPQVAAADLVIHPDSDGIRSLSPSPKNVEPAVAAGEKAAMAALPQIRKLISPERTVKNNSSSP